MKISKQQFVDFAILCLRYYLAYYMITYGWSKMTGGQFGVHDPAILEQPLSQVNEFYIAWYLFSLSPTFNIVAGGTQVLGGILIVIHRTALLGTLILLPVLVQIFLVDVSFTTDMFGSALVVRLAGMLLAAFLILWYYKDRMLQVWHSLTDNVRTKFNYQWWVYPILVVLGFLTDFALGLLLSPLQMLLDSLFFSR